MMNVGFILISMLALGEGLRYTARKTLELEEFVSGALKHALQRERLNAYQSGNMKKDSQSDAPAANWRTLPVKAVARSVADVETTQGHVSLPFYFDLKNSLGSVCWKIQTKLPATPGPVGLADLCNYLSAPVFQLDIKADPYGLNLATTGDAQVLVDLLTSLDCVQAKVESVKVSVILNFTGASLVNGKLPQNNATVTTALSNWNTLARDLVGGLMSVVTMFQSQKSVTTQQFTQAQKFFDMAMEQSDGLAPKFWDQARLAFSDCFAKTSDITKQKLLG